MMLHQRFIRRIALIRTGLFRFHLLALLCFFFMRSVIYGASLSDEPSPDCWITNGFVRSVVQNEDTIYLGGIFSYVGPFTGGAVSLAADTGQATHELAKVDGNVYAIASDGNGGWFVGGQFSKVESYARNNLAHILSDGSLDADWQADADGVVNALTVEGNSLFVGGAFTVIDGATRNRLAVIDVTTGDVTAWSADADEEVFALSYSDSTLYVGGKFVTIGGQSRNRIAALDAATGVPTSWDPNANNSVYAILVSESTVYVGGDFTIIKSLTRNRCAALSAATAIPTSFSPNCSSSVKSLALNGGTIYLGGAFTTVGGTARNRIAAVNATSGALATTWNPNADGTVNSLLVNGTTLHAAGLFKNIGGQARNYLAGVDLTSGLATSWTPNATAEAKCLAYTSGEIGVGGLFKSVGGVERNNIAAIDAHSGQATDWNPNANNQVATLVLESSQIYVGGNFTNIGGAARNRIASIALDTGLADTWNPNANNNVECIVPDGSLIYVGGNFTQINGINRSRVACIDASTAVPTAWNATGTSNNIVRTLALSDTSVYAGGTFTTIGGQARNYLAELDKTTGVPTAWNPGANNSISALVVDGDTLYAGGQFPGFGVTARPYLATFDLTTGALTDWNLDPSGFVYSLQILNSDLYAVGNFTSIGGETHGRAAIYDTQSQLMSNWDPDLDAQANTISASDARVVVGGNFTHGTIPASYLAVFEVVYDVQFVTDGTEGATLSGDVNQSLAFGKMTSAVTAVAPTGYQFVKWTCNDVEVSTANPLSITVDGDMTLRAEFEMDTVTLKYAAGDHGQVNGDLEQTVSYGGNGTSVVAIPDTGYEFFQWSDGLDDNPRTDVNVIEDIDVSALFVPASYTLAYSAGTGGSIQGIASQNVLYGENGSEVLAVPETGYDFLKWSDELTANPRQDLNVANDIAVTAIFAPKTYTLTYTAGTGGSVSGLLTQNVNHGTDGSSVTAIPNIGFEFVRWSDNSTENPRVDENVSGPISVEAIFAIKQYSVTYAAGENGSIQGSLNQVVNHGGSGSAVTAFPDPNYEFWKWSDDSSANPRQEIDVKASVSVTALFRLKRYMLTYSAGVGGSISGFASQEVAHGASGSLVTAVPNGGFEFVRWSDDSTENPRTDVNVIGPISVEAIFAIKKYNLTYTAGANGTVQGNLNQQVNHGGTGSAVTAVPADGYVFVEWSDGKIDNPRVDSGVTGDINVSAAFAQNVFQLTYHAGPHGRIEGIATQNVAEGSDGDTVTAVPDTGYHFVQWSDGVNNSARTDANVVTNIDVTAYFAINEYTVTFQTDGLTGATISGDLSQTVAHGGDCESVTAVAPAHCRFVKWTLNGEDYSSDNPLVVCGVSSNMNLVAVFSTDTATNGDWERYR